MAKKITALILMFAFVMSFVPTMAATGSTTARGSISYGAATQFTEDHTILAAHTEVSVTGYEMVDGEKHAIAMVTATGTDDQGTVNHTSIIDLEDQKILRTFTHRDYTGYGQVGDTTSDGKMIIGAGINFIQYDPSTKQLKHLGTQNSARSAGFGGMVIDEGRGLIYSTESAYGRVNATSLSTGKCTTIATLSSFFRRGSHIAQKGDYVYTSGLDQTGNTAYIFKVHKDKGTYEKLSPDAEKYELFEYTFDIGKYIVTQGKLKSGGTRLFAYDTTNGTWQRIDENGYYVIGTSMVTTITNGKRLLRITPPGMGAVLYTIDANLKFESTGMSYGAHLRGTGPWIEVNRSDVQGLCAVTAHFGGAVSLIHFGTKKSYGVNVTIPGPSVPHRISYLNPMDGILWVGGYKAATIPAINTKTGEIKYSWAEQPEGMIHDPATGLFYHGDYSGAHIREKDATKANAESTKVNVRGQYMDYYFGSLGKDQDRPFDLEIVGRELYIASMPNVSTPNAGALSVINLDTEEMAVWQGIVPGQSLITLTSKDNYLYFGTSVTVGSGQPVSEEPCKVVKFNMTTKQIEKQVDVKLSGVSGDLCAVKSLQISPDGSKLYAWTEGAYFTMDPDTLAITKQNVYGTPYVNATIGAQHWHNTKIYFEKNTGYIIHGDGQGGAIVDPDTLEIVLNSPGYGWFAGVDENSVAWFVEGTKVFKAPLNVVKKSYTLSKIDVVDNKTLKLTLDKAFTGNMVGDIVKNPDGTNATSVISQSVSGNTVTVTLASELPGGTYSIKPVGVSTAMNFVASDIVLPGEAGYDDDMDSEGYLYEFTNQYGTFQKAYPMRWKDRTNRGLNTEFVTGKSGQTGDKAFKWLIGVGNGGTGSTDNPADWQIGAGWLAGATIPLADTAIKDTTIVYNADFKLGAKTIWAPLIGPNFEGNYPAVLTVQGEEFKIQTVPGSGSTYIKNLTTHKTVGTMVPDTWYNLGAIIKHSSITGITIDFYLNYEKVYTYTDTNYKSKGLTSFEIFASPYTVIGDPNRYDTRGEYIYVDNFYVGDNVNKVKAPINYTFNTTDTANLLTRDSEGFSSYDSTNDIIRVWPGQGGKGNTMNTVARHNNSYSLDFVLPTEFEPTGRKIVFSFDFMRQHDSVACIRPMTAGMQRYNFAPGLDIDQDGNVSTITGITLTNISAYEYHDIKMVYTTYASEAMKFECYIDGKHYGPWTDGNSYCVGKNITSLRTLSTGYSRVGTATGSTRADSRPESVMFKNVVVTDNTSILPEGVQLMSVKNISDNEILFTANQAITAPVIDDVYLEGLTVAKVEQSGTDAFVVTVEDNGHACTKSTHQSYEVGETYSYDVYIGNDNFTGEFIEKHMGSIDYYDNNAWPKWVANTAVPGGNKMSTQWGITDGKNGYEGDGAFAWTPYQGATAVSQITYSKSGLGSFNWFNTQYGWNGGTGTLNNDKIVVSVDFMRGSDRVGGYPLALGSGAWSTTDIVFGAMVDQATGALTIGSTTIDANIGVKTWHNLTYHITLSDFGSYATVYYDGVNKGDFNMNYTAGIYTIRTWMASVQPTDAEIAALNCLDLNRFDAFCFDNFYIGRDFNYTTSDIVLTASGNDVKAYTGAFNRNNPGIAALYGLDGQIKNVSIRTITADKLSITTVTDALSISGAASGDLVKFFVVNDLLNIRPISNVVTKTVE